MSKNIRIVSVTCLAFALTHALLLGWILLLPGEGRMLLAYLEYPLLLIVRSAFPSLETASGLLVYFWLGGTLFYGLVVGGFFGFAFVGARHLFRWLNDEKWNHDA